MEQAQRKSEPLNHRVSVNRWIVFNWNMFELPLSRFSDKVSVNRWIVFNWNIRWTSVTGDVKSVSVNRWIVFNWNLNVQRCDLDNAGFS